MCVRVCVALSVANLYMLKMFITLGILISFLSVLSTGELLC